jgi:hypothetical protein
MNAIANGRPASVTPIATWLATRPRRLVRMTGLLENTSSISLTVALFVAYVLLCAQRTHRTLIGGMSILPKVLRR